MRLACPPSWLLAWSAVLIGLCLTAWPHAPDLPMQGWPARAAAVLAMAVALLDSLYWLRGPRERRRITPILFDARQTLRMALLSALPLVMYAAGALPPAPAAITLAAVWLPELSYALPPALLHTALAVMARGVRFSDERLRP